MKSMKTALALASSVAMFSLAPAAFSQTASEMINVDISNVAKDIAKNTNVDASRVPSTVQAPVDVAANVCHVAADVLRDQAKRVTGSCTAEITSDALDKLVQRQMKGSGQQ
jgi:hypothetical protein